ncbi:tripartite ATP-independent transporter solute receptor, DctP family [Sulfitobacter brevis]|uniref:Tripartite ATP-independent transporter solute receptor, DctP family n=1 Tax=Sulfitobacter brevis TaxID=74348 RepID=A0A1I2BUY4_9RHOB|nr:TRAP transporter substrate-binding protein [Sulfitobacter brevis]SFE59912.1 tripartite ATP-independent transporter solute receptor, DctP family [Sulfitobacter brevis]
MITMKKTAKALIVAAAFGTVGLPVVAAETLRVGWTTSDSAQDPYAIMAHNLQAELDQRLPGKFDVQMFPNNQLGDEKQMLEGLQYGTLDVGIITNASIANLDPAFQLNDMPFLFADEEQAHGVLDGEVGQEILGKLSGKGMIGLGFAEGGFRHMINNTRPVVAPDDVKGVKFRTMQNPVFIGMFSSLGGNPTPMAWSETFTAAQQGTIDGLEIPLAVIVANNYPEVTKYLSLTKHTYSALGIIASERTFAKLSDEEKAAFKESATAAISKQRTQVAEASAQLVQQLEDAGMTVNEIENPAAFREQVLPVYEEFRGAIGEELFNKALAEVKG